MFSLLFEILEFFRRIFDWFKIVAYSVIKFFSFITSAFVRFADFLALAPAWFLSILVPCVSLAVFLKVINRK